MRNQSTTQLGELISAMYDAARSENEDERTASLLAAVCAYDLLMRSGNSQLALKLLNT